MRFRALKHACVDAGQYGLNVSSGDYVASGVRLLRTTDLTEDGIGREGVYLAGPIETRFLVAAGDVLFTRSGATIGKAHLASQHDAGSAFAGYLVRFRPVRSTDPRYLFYTTQAKPFQEQVAADAVVSTIPNFNADRYANIRIPQPDLAEQRRIAGFLDDQVARIDNIIAARREQERLWSRFLQGEVDAAFEANTVVPVSRLARVLPGWAFPSDGFTADEEDVRLLRGINVGVGQIRWEDTMYWPQQRRNEASAFALARGDVVIGMDRPWIGEGFRIARISDHDLPCLLLQRVAKLQPGPKVNRDYLFWAYQTSAFRREIEVELSGVSVPHLSGDQILRHRVPFLDLSQQRAVIDHLHRISQSHSAARACLRRSAGLLGELKRSLITAAVTGEFDVSSADGSQVAI